MRHPGARARVPQVASGLVASVAMALTLGLAPAAADSAAVRMTEPAENHYAFAPTGVRVTTGSSVTWTNATDAPHTVTSDTGAFGSTTLNQNQTFSFTFATPGTYRYHCTIHPYMTGTITVAASGVAQPRAQGVTPARMPTTGGGGGDRAGTSGVLGALGFLVAIAGSLRLRHSRR